MMDACARYCAFLEALTPQSLARLAEHVAEDVRFADPFNDVRGRDAMVRVFRDMFEAVGPVRFTISRKACDGRTCMLAWRFSATLRGRPWDFDGTSVVLFGTDGKVIEHIDHWDAADAFYGKLPVIGSLLAAIRRRVRTD
jgi:steroid delta-isomerase